MGCLDDDTVDRLVRGELAGEALASVDAHLDTCGDCRALVSVLARGSGEDPAGPTLPRGTLIRRYVLGDVVGGGAMGTVYAAWDPELDRRVAIKVLREADGDPARALREAQAMARLAHPNVVTVHEAGTVDGHVFVAMELVAGVTLREWAREGREAPAVVDVMLQAGRGLAAAHAAGLVHRDVKPDNVIVGDDGRVRIGDFGLALGGAASTTEHAAGTPAYMAPEVLRGAPADARSDQYSYAVTFHEALHGARPDRAASRPAPAWIDAIVRRGLSGRPDERWPSIDAMLDALESGVAARKQRRVRRWLGLAAGVAVASAATAVVLAARRDDRAAAPAAACDTGAARIREIWDDAARARVRAALAGVDVPYAAGTATSVVATLDRWTSSWASADAAVCRATFVAKTQPPDAHAARTRCLDLRRDELAAMIARLGEADRGVALRAVDAVAGLPPPSECVTLPPGAADPLPADPDQRAIVDEVARGLARVDAATALGDWRRGIDDTAALVTRADATNHAPTVADAHRSRATALRTGGRLDDAEEEAFAALWAAERGHFALGEARAWIDLVSIAGERRDLDAAAERARHAAAAVARAGDPPALVASLETARGLIAYNRGALDEAAGVLASALERWRAITGDDSVEVARARSSLGSVARAQGRLDIARQQHEAALAIDRARLGDRHPAVARDLHNVAGVRRLAGDLAGALATYREALAIERAALGDEHAATGLTHNSIGLVLMEQGQLDAAQLSFQTALSILERAGSGERAIALHNLGLIAQRRGRHADALRWFDAAATVYAETIGADADAPRRLSADRTRSESALPGARTRARKVAPPPSPAAPAKVAPPPSATVAPPSSPAGELVPWPPAVKVAPPPPPKVAPEKDAPKSRDDVGVYGSGQAWP